jgi:hypothetical protein
LELLYLFDNALTGLLKENKMDRLLSEYLANPCDKTKTKLLNYIAKHPMAVCFATPEQHRLIQSISGDAQ